MGIIKKSEHTSLGETPGLKEIVSHIYTESEIDAYQLDKAINKHPLSHKPTNIRSKLAYAEIMRQLKPTTKYLLPGQLVVFNYTEPKFKAELEYYDRTPMTLFLGLIRTKDDTIREVGLNLHYYPPFARARIMQKCYEVFKPYWEKNFNEAKHKPNNVISYKALKHVMRHNLKLAFGIKMYIPMLRGNSYVLPARLFSTAYFTEGHFSKATLQQIFKFWRQF
jgi:hypothetical protein